MTICAAISPAIAFALAQRCINPPIFLNLPLRCRTCDGEVGFTFEPGAINYINWCQKCQQKRLKRNARRRELYRLRKARTL